MIAVIADDFTGAAEIGGIGLRHGLNVVIETEPVNGDDADLLIIATDTRSMEEGDAAKHIKYITRELLTLNPEMIYKKVDSVLRGNIKSEVMAQMEATGQNRAIIIAANPIFKRIISGGQYFIDDIPLNETCFASDPHHPVLSSMVTKVIGGDDSSRVYSAKLNEDMPHEGMVIGDVKCLDDLQKWTGYYNEDTLMAGASGFFDALLEKRTGMRENSEKEKPEFGETSFFVLGSTFPKENDFFRDIKKQGYFISNMPAEIYRNKNYDPLYFRSWVNDLVDGIKKHKKVVACVNHPMSDEQEIGCRINEIVGDLVKQVLDKVKVNELLIEGGSTTFKVLDNLGIKKLFPLNELDTGVIRMDLKEKWGFKLTTKPGSYFWPKDVWVPGDKIKYNNIAYD